MEALGLPRAASPPPSSKELGGGQLRAVSPQDPEGARPWGTGVPGRWAELGSGNGYERLSGQQRASGKSRTPSARQPQTRNCVLTPRHGQRAVV